MNIRLITEEDIPKWEKLSIEHDCYVKELNSGFAEWYAENKQSHWVLYKNKYNGSRTGNRSRGNVPGN